MKTLITITAKIQFQSMASKIGKLIILLIVCSMNLVSQNSAKSPYLFGMSVGAHASGNAHGVIYDASAGLYNGKNMFSLGACIQKRSMDLSGARFKYTRILTGQEDFASKGLAYATDASKLQLFFYSTVEYLNNAELCYNAVKKEETLVKNQGETSFDCNKMKLSTIDVSAGIGLNVKLSKQIVWSNYIGFGAYYHLNYTAGMYSDKAAPVLVIGTALRLNYFTR